MNRFPGVHAPLARKCVFAVVAQWALLWALVPSLLVWGVKPYVRQATFSFDGRSHAELEAELNTQYALEYFIIGGSLGLTSGVGSLRLTRSWQVIAMSVAVGVALVTVFNLRNAPRGFGPSDMARDAIQMGGCAGVLLGVLLVVVHRRTRIVHQ